MDASRLVDWLQVVANLGIVVGLLLVAVQIDLDREKASTELSTVVIDQARGYWETIVGEDAASSLARAVYEPEALTSQDKIVLDALYWAEANKALQWELVLDSDELAPPEIVLQWANITLTNPYAMAWWRETEAMWQQFAPKMRSAIDAAVAQQPASQRARLDRIDSMMSTGSRPSLGRYLAGPGSIPLREGGP